MKQIFILSRILFLLMVTSLTTSAQDTTTYYGKMNYVFEHVDKSQVTTGLLRDYGIDFLNLDNYTGVTLHDSNFVSMDE